MAFRADISINWSQSPRIITVAAPSVELSAKDLYDTLRMLEAGLDAIDEKQIVSGGGYESLGGGDVVGLTVTLLNALVAFESRTGPEFIQCFISGGNVVALTADLETYVKTPLQSTAYTQIVLANSSSATQSEQKAIQYSSYQNGVTIDVLSPITGTEYPAGTKQYPVNNAIDAINIANEAGFDVLYIIGNCTFTTGHDINDFSIYGQNAVKSEIIVEPGALANKVEIFESHLLGTLDGESTIRECLVTDLSYISGFVNHCILSPGTIMLDGGATAYFLDCFSGVPGYGIPVIDCGGSGQSLAIRGYSGGIKITNKTGSEAVSIDLSSGQVILSNTVTKGLIVVRGDGKLTDEAGNNILTGNWNGADITNETTSIIQPNALDSISDTVWSYPITSVVSGSIGEYVTKKLLTFKQFIGLK